MIFPSANSMIGRWKRREAAERKTPRVIWGPEGRGYRCRSMRLGELEVLDYNGQPHVAFGGTTYSPAQALPLLRVPTDADAAKIETAEAVIQQAHEAAERLYLAAFKRGRQPTLDEVRTAVDQVRTETGEQ